MGVSVFQLNRQFQEELEGIYPPGEIRSLSRLIIEHVTGLSRSRIHAEPGIELPEDTVLQINEILQGLKQYKPVQYMLGQTEFYGITFNVNSDALIPRPETEELVEWVVRDNQGKTGLRILDIGTGTGNIAISLSKNLPGAEVWATDVSPATLRLAKENARNNSCMVHFLFSDILHASSASLPGSFDLIVSNPPYIPFSERASLPANVEGYEPSLALFVEDEDPILFYRRIASFARMKIKQGGTVYVEVHEKYGCDVLEMFIKEGFPESELRKDINGKPRMVKAVGL
jgi:release factor glutamine methyltransferase